MGGAVIAYDTETTGLNVHRDEVFAYSICEADSSAATVYPEVYRLDGSAVRRYTSRVKLEDIWKEGKAPKVMHKSKFDLPMTERVLGRSLKEQPFHDTMIQSHLIRSNHPSHALKDLAWELAGIPKDDEDAIKKFLKGKKGDRNYSMVPEPIMTEYQERDALRTILLHHFFYPQIKSDPKMLEVYNNELDLIRTSIDIERRGMMLNPQRCHTLINSTERAALGVLDDIEQYAGRRINPDSPNDLHWLLFQKAGLPITRYTKTGKPCTEKEVLFDLRREFGHHVIESVLKFRSWSKAVTTMRSYLKLMDADHIIHPTLNTCEADTGRESCSNPNLQNVPKMGVLLNPYAVPVRSLFMPRPGHVIFYIDFSGIEFRLAVYYSRDQTLINLVRSGGDPHALAAEIFFGDQFRNERDPAIKKTMRNAAKNMNFAIIYGAGVATIAAGLNLPVSVVMARYQEYKRRLPGLAALSERMTKLAQAQGYVETVFGRRLYVPRGQAFVATNYLIQGTAADILKRAQVRVDKYLKAATGGEVAILLPIHDELVIEYPRKRMADVQEVLRSSVELMQDFPEIDVPLDAEMQVAAANWESKSPFKLTA